MAVLGALLGACNVTSFGENGNAPPDSMDRIRATDLQPRFPAPAEAANTGAAGGPRAARDSGSTPAPAAAPAPTPGGEGFDFNFENTPVTTVAKVILGDILGVGYTIDPRVQGTVTLTSGHPVPKNDVLFVLESALRTSNVALVRERTGYRLVPAPEAIGSAGADPSRDPEPGYGITVIPLQYASVQTVSKLLDSFAAKPGAIRADQSRNLLLVQGTGAERRAALDTVLSFDRDWMRGQSVGIYPIRNTTPEPVITELEKIIDSGEGGLNQNLVKLQAVARMNAVLVVSRKPELLRTVATWINRLDASETASTGVKVYRVRYGDARQIARLLNDIFLGGGAGGSLDSAASQLAPGGGAAGMSTFDRLTGATQSSAATPGGLPAQPTPAGGGLGSGGLGSGGLGSSGASPLGARPFGAGEPRPGEAAGTDSNVLGGRGAGGQGPGAILAGVRITADVVNNALLIYANQENYRVIERAINQLDRPQLQVAIDLTIAEVTLNDSLNFGVQTLLTAANLGLPTSSGQAINTAVAQPLAQVFPGANILVGSLANPQVIINALHNYTNVKVLSNPSLVVLDHQAATLQVGDQVPITTGTATVLSANNAVVNTINYQNTGIILRVVPKINSNGKVTLDIEQEISNVAPQTAGSLTPTISQRRVKSSISVVTGQTVLLAGLISETQNRGRTSIPFLDQVPLLGDAAATDNRKSLARTELIIFIRPQIIRDSVDAAAVAEELRSRLRGGKVGSFEPPGAAETPTPQVVR